MTPGCRDGRTHFVLPPTYQGEIPATQHFLSRWQFEAEKHQHHSVPPIKSMQPINLSTCVSAKENMKTRTSQNIRSIQV